MVRQKGGKTMFSLIPWAKNQNGTRSGAVVQHDNNPFALLRREFDSLFDSFFNGWPAPMSVGWGLDVEDAGKEMIIRAEAPGFEANEFDVQLRGEQLYIRAEHKEENKKGEGEERSTSSRYGVFERWVTLPGGVDADKVEARYRNGVLEIHLPKTPEAVGRKIEVKT
jgi:HSP20 family protein